VIRGTWTHAWKKQNLESTERPERFSWSIFMLVFIYTKKDLTTIFANILIINY